MLYSPDMVVSILDDSKTKTRRQLSCKKWIINDDPNRYKFHGINTDVDPWAALFEDLKPEITPWLSPIPCPYQEGDVVWVKETFYAFGYWSLLDGKWTFNDSTLQFGEYRFQGNIPYAICTNRNDGIGWYKRPSIFMPKIAARIWLEVTDITVERLHHITDGDALAEGIKRETPSSLGGFHLETPNTTLQEQIEKECYYFYPCNDLRDDSYIDKPATSFTSLWASINGWKSWNANPWVWVISFKVLSKTGKPVTNRKEALHA